MTSRAEYEAALEAARKAMEAGATTPKALAEAVGVSERTAARYMVKLEAPPRRNPHLLSDQQVARMEQLISEQLPNIWIAEDVRVDSKIVSKTRKRMGAPSSDFSKVWGGIRTNPKLLELHREFAPAGRRYGSR